MFAREFFDDNSENTLLDVFGVTVRSGDYLFTCCAIDAEYSDPAFPSTDYIDTKLPEYVTDCNRLDNWFIDGEEATVFWGCARIWALFKVLPPFSVLSESFQHQPFLAIDLTSGLLNAYPFLWTNADGHLHDYYHSCPSQIARIYFAKFTPENQRVSISRAFWKLLLSDASHVSTYSQIDDASTFTFSLNGGCDLYIFELDMEDAPNEFENSHNVTFGRCEDCDGLGEEYL